MKGGLIVGAPQPHRRADQERDDADEHQHQVFRGRAAWNRLQRQLVKLLAACPQDRIGQQRALAAGVKERDQISMRLYGGAVDGQQHVARRDARQRAGRPGGHFACHQLPRALHPQHTILGLGPARAQHVGQHQAQKDRHDTNRQQRLAPTQGAPPIIGVTFGRSESGHVSLGRT